RGGARHTDRAPLARSRARAGRAGARRAGSRRHRDVGSRGALCVLARRRILSGNSRDRSGHLPDARRLPARARSHRGATAADSARLRRRISRRVLAAAGGVSRCRRAGCDLGVHEARRRRARAGAAARRSRRRHVGATSRSPSTARGGRSGLSAGRGREDVTVADPPSIQPSIQWTRYRSAGTEVGTPDRERWTPVAFPAPPADRPWVFGVVVTSANGVVAWRRRDAHDDPVREILGGDTRPDRIADRRLMRYLRTIGDVGIGAQTMREQPTLILTPQEPDDQRMPELYAFRVARGLPHHPRNIIYSLYGRVPPEHPMLTTRGLSPIIVTTSAGRDELARRGIRDAAGILDAPLEPEGPPPAPPPLPPD